MNFFEEAKPFFNAGMAAFLSYAFLNFLWEIYNEQQRYKAIWAMLSTTQQTLANIQMMLMDFVLMVTVLCVILFIRLNK